VYELADSSGVLGDPAVLRQRLTEAGYLFFRGLLPASTVRAVGAAVLARLRDGGWASADGAPSGQPRAVYPERPGPRARARHVHYDYAVGGGQDMLTARPPGPSRFFAVHPGWQAWRPPPSAVH
jgi:hypothetical protein